MKRAQGLLITAVAAPLAVLAAACGQQSPADFQKGLQEKLITAKHGSVIELPAGKFHFDRTLSLTADGVTIRGKGMHKTILSFAGQKEGASGMLVKANDFVIEDVAIEDTAGDGLTVQGGTNITIRRVRVEWTRGPNENNGPYAIYPAECKNVLVEDSIAKGAVDAGIYIGQSDNVILRRNRAEYNVDGIEIENAEHVDAYENVATHNTGGISIFNLPDLPKQGGKFVRVFANQVVDNNNPNFAPKSMGPIYYLPTGNGILVMSIGNVEIFQNTIKDNHTANVTIMHYNTVLEYPIKDKRFNPYTELIHIHDNVIAGGGASPDVRIDSIKKLAAAAGSKLADVLYDGQIDPKTKAEKIGPNEAQICLANNGDATFLNLDLPNQLRHITRDVKTYHCWLPPVDAVYLPQLTGGAPTPKAGDD